MNDLSRGRWKDLDTATVSDALDRCGIAGQAAGVLPLHRSFRIHGPAFTVRLVPDPDGSGKVGDYIDDVRPGAVVVLDNGGRLDATVWGDLLTVASLRRGIAGTVIHGACRDVARVLEAGYPLFSRGVTMRTGKGRVAAAAFGTAVSLGTARVEPEDWVLGDADGVVVVPRRATERVWKAARDIAAAEAAIRAAVLEGTPLAVARRASGYHDLQRGRS